MGTFFKGWRRKAGCVTLAMALLTLSVWIRGQFVVDIFTLPWNRSDITVGTDSAGFGVQYRVDESTPQAFEWLTFPTPTPTVKISFDERQEFCGIGIAQIANLRNAWISHWWFIAPLTLLSTYLLLNRPRPPKIQVTAGRPVNSVCAAFSEREI